MCYYLCNHHSLLNHFISIKILLSQENLCTSFCFFFFLVILGFEFSKTRQALYHLSHSIIPFCVGYFWDRVLWTIYLGWLWTATLLISASWVARIIGVSHLHQVAFLFCLFIFADGGLNSRPCVWGKCSITWASWTSACNCVLIYLKILVIV
jgi:hypothetical protein